MKATIKCVGDVFRQETPIPMVRHEHDEAGETQGQEPEEALHTLRDKSGKSRNEPRFSLKGSARKADQILQRSREFFSQL